MYILGIHHREHICTYLSTFMEMSFTLHISNNTESTFTSLPMILTYIALVYAPILRIIKLIFAGILVGMF